MFQPSKLVFVYNLHCKLNLYFRTIPSPKAKYCRRFLKSSGVLGSESGRLSLRYFFFFEMETNVASKILFSNCIESERVSGSFPLMPNTRFPGRRVPVPPPRWGRGRAAQGPAVTHAAAATHRGDHGPRCLNDHPTPRVRSCTWGEDQCPQVHKTCLWPWDRRFLLCLLYQDMHDLSLGCICIPLCKSTMDKSGIKGLAWQIFWSKRVGLVNVAGDAYLHADDAVFPKYTSTLPFF